MTPPVPYQSYKSLGHKVQDDLENPLTVMTFLPWADAVVDRVHGYGLTPNHITLVSMLLRAWAVYAAWYHYTSISAIVFLIAYWFDCLDGILARRHNLVTRLGDWLDHINDVCSCGAMVLVIVLRYNPSWLWIVTWLLSLCGACVHMGLVEQFNLVCNREADCESNVLYLCRHLSQWLEPPAPPGNATDLVGDEEDHFVLERVHERQLHTYRRHMMQRMQYTRCFADVNVIIMIALFLLLR